VDLPHGPSPAVRITVLLRLASEGFADAFGADPAWVEAPAAEHDRLEALVGGVQFAGVAANLGLRRGERYRAGGPAGTVELAGAALDGVDGLLGQAPMAPDVLVEETPDGPGYQVPDTWFVVVPAAPGEQAQR
jgi:hypothetical protein